jgi:uncharacterized protein YfaT (DUF1175 family)
LLEGCKVMSTGGKKETKLGIEARKEEDLSGWYTQVWNANDAFPNLIIIHRCCNGPR